MRRRVTLARTIPSVVVTELDVDGGSGEAICRAAKELIVPATVLVPTPHAARAPRALLAGCEGVLLKPFAPDLLRGRIGRLLRERANIVRLRAARARAKSAHLIDRSRRLTFGTNAVWPRKRCPYCQQVGVTSFAHASEHRDSSACVACSKVWIADRRENGPDPSQ
jgi:DNA-binding response OmpR family regulator